MTGNYFECGNEVIVEGFSLGHFSSFNVSNSRDVIGATAEIKIPLYTISVTDKQRPVADSLRIGVDGAQLATGGIRTIRPCSIRSPRFSRSPGLSEKW